MIVVADSGPLHYLILLEQVDLLRRFYGQAWCLSWLPASSRPLLLPELCVSG